MCKLLLQKMNKRVLTGVEGAQILSGDISNMYGQNISVQRCYEPIKILGATALWPVLHSDSCLSVQGVCLSARTRHIR